jgi:hypothetical protein
MCENNDTVCKEQGSSPCLMTRTVIGPDAKGSTTDIDSPCPMNWYEPLHEGEQARKKTFFLCHIMKQH